MLNSSKFIKGLGSILMVSGLAISPVAIGDNMANAESTQTNTGSNQENYEIDQNVANIIYTNLEKNQNDELKIIDKENLKKELNDSGTDINIKDIENYMNRYNETMKGENGEKAKKDLVAFNKEVEKQQQQNSTSNRDACDALTVAGFGHTAATTGAMAALGVSGPVGWGVGTGMAALYAGGSIACNHA